ncbi:hypothetical protein FQN57_004670 [Myotisia sp. PD_48]|nr:hypothetical protein FQN57_004670 [Myotisia sp. PD_48]
MFRHLVAARMKEFAPRRPSPITAPASRYFPLLPAGPAARPALLARSHLPLAYPPASAMRRGLLISRPPSPSPRRPTLIVPPIPLHSRLARSLSHPTYHPLARPRPAALWLSIPALAQSCIRPIPLPTPHPSPPVGLPPPRPRTKFLYSRRRDQQRPGQTRPISIPAPSTGTRSRAIMARLNTRFGPSIDKAQVSSAPLKNCLKGSRSAQAIKPHFQRVRFTETTKVKIVDNWVVPGVHSSLQKADVSSEKWTGDSNDDNDDDTITQDHDSSSTDSDSLPRKSILKKRASVRSTKSVRFAGGNIAMVEKWIEPGVHTYRAPSSLWGNLHGWTVKPLAEPDCEGETEKYIQYWGSDRSSMMSDHHGGPCGRTGCAWNRLADIQKRLNAQAGIGKHEIRSVSPRLVFEEFE